VESNLGPGSSSPISSNNNFSNNDDAAISVDVASFPSLVGNTSSGNGTNGVDIRGGTINTNTNWNQTNMVHRLIGDVTVANGATLTIAPGMIIKFDAYRKLIIDGKLLAVGTSGQLVYFTSYRDDTVGGDTDGVGGNAAAGDWGWIEFHPSSDDASQIAYAVVRYGGFVWPNRRGNIYLIDASPTIQNSTLSNSDQDGIYVESNLGPGASSPMLSNNTFSNNDNAAISVDVVSFPSLGGNNSSNNGTNGVDIRGGTINTNTNWNQTNMVHRLIGDVTVANGATLTIAPGMIIKFDTYVRLVIDGKLTAIGASGRPIHFTSYRDDTIGGDTDGGPSSGAKGDWGWIEFHPSSDDASQVAYAVVRYGGFVWPNRRGNIYLIDASPTIQNSTLSNSDQDGIYASNSTPTLMCNNIQSNDDYGIRNITTGMVINAVNQYWGSATGPYHATLNSSGQGNDVSDGVSFSPWRTSACPTSPQTYVFMPLVVK
jgi:hypothetical protein